MLKYTVKRLAQSLVTILLIATIVFLLMRCLPTDYYFTEEQLMKFTEEQKFPVSDDKLAVRSDIKKNADRFFFIEFRCDHTA